MLLGYLDTFRMSSRAVVLMMYVVQSPTDCSYFDDFPMTPVPQRSKRAPNGEDSAGKDNEWLAWIGYTWKRFPDAVKQV